ncbi:MAG: nucleoside-diphosphate sugar epimerase/dehydratase [Erysipelotrichaceae bacterium]|nr:nucleoside-diphosphate sugar epimerase/dehydratase [Erysipelotrichaceae bacterium]
MSKTQPFHFEHWQIIALFVGIYDVITICFSYLFGLLLRFDFHFTQIPEPYLLVYYKYIIPFALLSVAVYWFFNLYRSVWRFASYHELRNILIATTVCGVLNYVITRIFGARMPYSYHLIGYIMQLIFAVAIRFVYRFGLLIKNGKRNSRNTDNVMLIGAGDAGMTILRDINKNLDSTSKVVCIIDDNTNKIGRFIEGVPVVGSRDDILENVEKYNVSKIVYAIPSSTGTQKRDILNICRETDCEIKVLPGIQQLVRGDVSVSMLKSVAIEDLLGRDVVKVNTEEIFNFINDKVVMVTGGGGSIGSELCRQIASHHPKQLIIFDIYENNAYDIEQELKRNHPELNLVVLIGSVRDSKRVDYVFDKYRPEIVYHAAAHKHVPLMENSPCEAIKNNAIGTFKTAYAAVKYGTKRFVLISTDKAVNPTNVMGATKRMCEMIIQTFEKLEKSGETDKLSVVENCFSETATDKLMNQTEFVAVRFGNVLGSNGSVIPLFKKQIEAGGPVTVTHPDIIRYFMTIPEAVSLVLQAGVYAKGGEIFILDMGEPVKIDTLARNLIKLSGLKPDEDIKIEYTGLRPGEKLYEEKLMAAEGNMKTDNDLIFVGQPLDIDIDKFLNNLKDIHDVSYDNREDLIYDYVEKIVPTYKRKEA